ncbi:MAG: substrate-binding domain-containing protein [Desulforegulaceae bacterium]|nr:substrate-binding domain-containing protein [Desulforegulaceae bacterium]
MKKNITIIVLLLFALCNPAFSENIDRNLMMATTTSTDNTGLLDYLMPAFTKETGIKIHWTAVGTGKALKMGENCDVDVLLVHAPLAEKDFIEKGFGKSRTEIMYNDFIIVGDKSDPAGIRGLSSVDALKRIMDEKALFVSRGDNSGTHKKELNIWKDVSPKIPEKEAWYIQAGQGMLATLNMAAEKKAYTLTDRGTFIKYMDQKKEKLSLDILVEGSKNLKNQYSVIPVNPKNCPNVKYEYAVSFKEWMASPKAQEMIKNFKLLGKPLFIPNADN